MNPESRSGLPRLGAPFHAVITAEQTGAYKPRVQAFDHMLEQIDAKPSEFLHISSHQLYDHIPMAKLGFTNKVFLDRGYDPDLPEYGAVRMTSLDEVNGALRAAAESGPLKGILAYSEEPLVSIDLKHNPASSTVDSLETAVLEGKLVRVVSWYDNEWGFSNRMVDTAVAIAKLG